VHEATLPQHTNIFVILSTSEESGDLPVILSAGEEAK
jgi:hypothetical protein